MGLKKTFDFATMIYCDYGVLPPGERQVILSKIHEHLKPGGKLLLDVFSMRKFCVASENSRHGKFVLRGFWREVNIWR